MTDLSKEFRQLEAIRQGERIRFTMLLIVGVLVVALAIWVMILAGEGLFWLPLCGTTGTCVFVIFRGVQSSRSLLRGL